MNRRALFTSTVYMMLWQGGNYLIPLLTFPYLTRTLGVRGYGEFGLAFSIAAYLVMITDWGFALSATGAVARANGDRDEISTIFWNVLAAKALLAAACLSMVLVAVLVVPAARPMAGALFASSAQVIVTVLTVGWCLQGLNRLGSFAFAATFGRAIAVPATFVLVHGPSDVWIAAAVQSGSLLVGGITSLGMLVRLDVIRRSPVTWARILERLHDSWRVFLSVASENLYTTTNTVVVGALGGPVPVGFYNAAERIRAAAQGVISPISLAIYPRTNYLLTHDRSRGIIFIRRLVVVQGAFTGAISLTLVVLAPLVIGILAGGRYAAAVPALQILAGLPFLAGIANALGLQLMLPLGHKRHYGSFYMRAAVLNLVMAPALTYTLGIVGAAISALLAQAFITGSIVRYVLRRGLLLTPQVDAHA